MNKKCGGERRKWERGVERKGRRMTGTHMKTKDEGKVRW